MTRKPLVVALLIALVVIGTAWAVVSYYRAPRERAPSGEGGFQLDPDHPCGVVCAAVASQVLGKPCTLRQAREAVAVDGLARTSMADLVDGFRRLGFASSGLRLTPRLLDSSPAPVILHVDNAHFLVVLPVGDGSAVVLDPPNPVHTESVSVLALRWDGNAILVQTSPEDLRKALAYLGVSKSGSSGAQ